MATLLRPFSTLDVSLGQIARDIDGALDSVLALPGDGRDRLVAAMRHAAIGGGKRLRPLLVQASADLFDVPRCYALRAGLAIECLHVHSLIHDDLPCMDDDDLRRGKPTVHRAFDEATAVLAGDALHALAFEILAEPATHPDAAVRATLVAQLARAAGVGGMAGGQMLDLLPVAYPAGVARDDTAAVVRLQGLKTGGLIGWCVDAGAVMGGASASDRASLRRYADCLGLAFQIADDLLDAAGDEAAAGKRLGKDRDQGKTTFVSLLGIDGARDYARDLAQAAVAQLAGFDYRAGMLKDIALFAVTRDH